MSHSRRGSTAAASDSAATFVSTNASSNLNLVAGLAATPWETTGAVDKRGASVTRVDTRAGGFVGNAYFVGDGTFTMYELDDTPSCRVTRTLEWLTGSWCGGSQHLAKPEATSVAVNTQQVLAATGAGNSVAGVLWSLLTLVSCAGLMFGRVLLAAARIMRDQAEVRFLNP